MSTDKAEEGDENSIEQAAILQCLREQRKLLGFPRIKEMARGLTEIDPTLEIADVTKCLSMQSVKRDIRNRTVTAAIKLLREHLEEIVSFYTGRNQIGTAEYIKRIVLQQDTDGDADNDSRTDIDHTGETRSITEKIFDNWKTLSRRGTGESRIIEPGIYQAFRRYKPLDVSGDAQLAGNDRERTLDHFVIVEVFYLDTQHAILITSQLNIYTGTIFINHKNILFSLLQRRSGRANGINHRFVAVQLRDKPRRFYSGLCMKVGDTTHQPVASECLFVPVPKNNHVELWESFGSLLSDPANMPLRVSEMSIFFQYVTQSPPSDPEAADGIDARRLRRVRDFPLLAELSRPRPGRPALLREPSRTLDDRDIWGSFQQLPVFRHT